MSDNKGGAVFEVTEESIKILQLRQILDRRVPDHAEEIIHDVTLVLKRAWPFDPPTRELTLDEEIGRMIGEGCPNGD
jgi:hypothetical protein